MEENLSKKEKKALQREQNEKDARKKNAMTWIVGSIIGLVVLFGIFSLFSGDGSNNNISDGPVDHSITKEDHIKGDFDAPVTLVEYSDFQCPACGSYYPIVKQLSEEFPDALRIVYRHFPLRRIHPNAADAARAVEAASLQGKFWEMHDMLFENQNFWSDARNPKDDFVSYAGQIGLDVEQFEDDYDNNDSLDDLVREDELRANALGLNSTPSFVLNGQKITNPRSLNEFIELIERNIPEGFERNVAEELDSDSNSEEIVE